MALGIKGHHSFSLRNETLTVNEIKRVAIKTEVTDLYLLCTNWKRSTDLCTCQHDIWFEREKGKAIPTQAWTGP
jgi:hypothetical protein